ncbi:peptidoglycan DD-metalloendopeptidase family protein [Candidatus Gracilibacteria bacterium]|jgi:murein DD-endopeptidase MepM/ murein hydrolase activator NlpD|nr:peptidoglycan DD-metalloendopeptidase family protein [Candidatus Gracilibacteria bacterium]
MRYLYNIIILALVLGLGSVVFAQELAQEQAVQEADGAKVLENVKSTIRNKSGDLTDLSRNVGVIEEELSSATERISTLEEQIVGLDEEVSRTSKKVEASREELNQLKERIVITESEILETNDEIAEQKELISELIRFIYVQNIEIGGFDSSVSQTIKLLFADESAGEQLATLSDLEYLEVSQRDLVVSLEGKIKQAKSLLVSLNKDKIASQKTYNELRRQENLLTIQRQAKVDLLAQTQGKVEIYADLLIEAQAEEVEIRNQIRKLALEYDKLAKQIEDSGLTFGANPIGSGNGDGKLSWPILPERGVSAFFKDSSYKAALGVEHNAIDIRATMATPVLAAEDGIIYKVKGGDGLDYHYIIIAHRNGILTLYGHMYDIFVTEGQPIRAGQQIGLSGGLPGSRGAGYLTTGPHLHFEVIDNGRHADPLNYLDLTKINLKYLPEKYLQNLIE